MSLSQLLDKLEAGSLGPEEIDAAFAVLMDGRAGHDEVKRFLALTTPLMRDPIWLASGARALRTRMASVQAPDGAIDVCGTGGDGAHTLNISTAVAFVAAGCGVPVAKHGNRAMSSKSGAADVLEALGVKLTADVPTLERCLNETGIAFLFAQNHHPAMRHVAAARRELGHRTIFNLLGPLANPAGVKRQLVGVFSPDFVAPMAEALRELGCERAWVVHGAGGLDELAPGADGNHIASLEHGVIAYDPSAANAIAAPHRDLRGGTASENAEELRALFDGAGRAGHREAVALNAAAALIVAGWAKTIEDGDALARNSIDSGAARAALDKLVVISWGAP